MTYRRTQDFPDDVWILIYDFIPTNIIKLLNRKIKELVKFRRVRKIINQGNIDDNLLKERSTFIYNMLIRCERLGNNCFSTNMDFKNLISLTIEGSDMTNMTIFFLELIKNGEITNLTEIRLDLSDPKFIGDRLKNIMILNRLKSLEIICLKLRRRNIDENIFKTIMESLQNDNINTLQFDFVASKFMKGALRCLSMIPTIKNLSTLLIDATGAKIPAGEIMYFSQIALCTNLMILKIAIWGTDQNNSAAVALGNIGDMEEKYANKMRNLSIDVGGNAITDAGIEPFGKYIKFKNALKITFGLQGLPITHIGIRHLLYVKDFIYLEKLILYLGYCQLGDDGVREISKLYNETKKKDTISSLCFDLRGNGITNDGIVHLKKIFKIKSLKFASIHCTGNSIGNNGAIEFINAVKNNENKPKVLIDMRQNPLEDSSLVENTIMGFSNITLQVDAR